MKKLDNRGMTIIELLVSFILLVIIMASLYNTITVYRVRQNVESYRSKIISYKNLLTHEIQDDIIKKGLIHAEIIDNELDNKNDWQSDEDIENKYKRFDTDTVIKLMFKDGSKKVITVTAKHALNFGVCSNSNKVICNTDHDDIYSIGYGTSTTSDDYVVYPLPDLGYSFNGNGTCSKVKPCKTVGYKIYDFTINNVAINLENNIFSMYVGLYHPNFETRYSINIVTPLKLV